MTLSTIISLRTFWTCGCPKPVLAKSAVSHLEERGRGWQIRFHLAKLVATRHVRHIRQQLQQNAAFFSTFPMFVPSLSWQNEHF
jgi:hypothetical protein